MRRGSMSRKANRIKEIAPNSKNPFAPEHGDVFKCRFWGNEVW